MPGQTTQIARAIIEVLRPLTGTPAYGFALVKATGADVLLPKNSYAAPIVASGVGTPPLKQIDRENLVRTVDEVVVNTIGKLVPIKSILGGLRQNRPVDTELRWDPPIDGVELVSTVSTGPTTGGAESTAVDAVGQVILYEELRASSLGLDLFRALAERGAPCVVVTWNDAAAAEKFGRDRWTEPNRWVLFVVVGNATGGSERASQGLDVCDSVVELLGDRASIAGIVFSAPPASVMGRRRVATDANTYVYAVELKTYNYEARRIGADTAEEVYPEEWERTRYDLLTGGVHVTFPVVRDAEYDMLLPAFDDGFDTGYGGRDG